MIIKTFSLNFGAIQDNPFEFFRAGDPVLRKLSDILKSRLDDYFENETEKNMQRVVIDKQNLPRFSVLKNQKVYEELVVGGRELTESEFHSLWDSWGHDDPVLRAFDYLSYRVLLDNRHLLSTKDYFRDPAYDIGYKSDFLTNLLKTWDVDIAFVQESYNSCQVDLDIFDQISSANGESLILAKKKFDLTRVSLQHVSLNQECVFGDILVSGTRVTLANSHFPTRAPLLAFNELKKTLTSTSVPNFICGKLKGNR